jgi:cytochrome c
LKKYLCDRLFRLALICLLPATVQSQSVSNGQKIVEKNCLRCHELEFSADAPALRGVVGRKAGKLEGYFFSEALEQATHTWDVSHLKVWLSNPQNLIPGVEMDFHLEGAQDIDDVIAYLSTLTMLPAK